MGTSLGKVVVALATVASCDVGCGGSFVLATCNLGFGCLERRVTGRGGGTCAGIGLVAFKPGGLCGEGFTRLCLGGGGMFTKPREHLGGTSNGVSCSGPFDFRDGGRRMQSHIDVQSTATAGRGYVTIVLTHVMATVRII